VQTDMLVSRPACIGLIKLGSLTGDGEMSKAKPRWGFTDTGFEAPTCFTQDDNKEISTLLGTPLGTDYLSQLNNATKRYLAGTSDRPPNTSEVRAALLVVEKRSQELLICLEDLDDITRDHLLVSGEIYNRAQQDVQSLWLTAQKALRDLPVDKGGRPAKAELREYIIKLADIFEEVVKSRPTVSYNDYLKNPYSGSFFNFVQFCLDHINKPPFSNQSLGGAII